VRLLELRPAWLGAPAADGSAALLPLKKQAHGVLFLCPKCFLANGGAKGTHSVICWDPTVPLTVDPGPGRWRLEGIDFEDLTLVAGSSSVKLTEGCLAHFYIRDGSITFC
jgi:hypothetical protein